jgi:Zn-dependent peptidase ImmA (M78 family)
MKKIIEFRLSSNTLKANKIFIRVLPLPLGVKGFCTKKNNIYIVCINSNINQNGQNKTLSHEIKHLLNKDLYSNRPVSELEQ